MKVYYSKSFNRHKTCEEVCKEEALGAKLHYNGMDWVIPRIYTSSKGIVLDICRRIPIKEYEDFYKKYKDVDEKGLTEEEERLIVSQNPLGFAPDFKLSVNDEEAESEGWSATGWIPPEIIGDELGMQMEEGKQLVDYYGLDKTDAWQFFRYVAGWPGEKECVLKSLELTISVRQEEVRTETEFEIADDGNQVVIPFVNPIDKRIHELVIEKADWQEIAKDVVERMGRGDFEYPRQYMVMSYYVKPELSEEYNMQIRDCEQGDNPIWKKDGKPSGASSVAVIGGFSGRRKSDVNTAEDIGDVSVPVLKASCSRMYFKRQEKICWGISVFYTPCQPKCFKLK